jgi:hypothetical protein
MQQFAACVERDAPFASANNTRWNCVGFSTGIFAPQLFAIGVL